MRHLPTLLLVAGVAVTSGGATDCGQVIDDRGFDLWCGDRLCRWALEKGQIAPAPTWHAGDHGVEMVGADVAISQLTEVASTDGRCVGFDLVADVAADAEVHLLVDVYGDGTIERDERIPTSAWRPVAFRLRMPEFYQGVRFRLTKTGGHAVLANIGAAIADDAECVGPTLEAGLRPDGVICGEDAECASGDCVPGPLGSACGECTTDADCAGGDVCGIVSYAEASRGLWAACVAPASTATGLACVRDAQCATGICAGGYCSACRDDSTCGGGACAPIHYVVDHADRDPTDIAGALHCTGGPLVASGGACLADGDCASGACVGDALAMCTTSFFPRACTTDMECPGYAFGGEPACVNVGTRGGTCQ